MGEARFVVEPSVIWDGGTDYRLRCLHADTLYVYREHCSTLTLIVQLAALRDLWTQDRPACGCDDTRALAALDAVWERLEAAYLANPAPPRRQQPPARTADRARPPPA
jgi:hypothetical protein